MFTLTDPRATAWAEAFSSVGGSLGQSLARYLENKKTQEALGNVTPEMPLNERLKVFSKHNLSPQTIERLTSPQFIQQQNLERAREALKNLDLSKMTPKNMPEYLKQIVESVAGTGLEKSAGDILNAFVQRGRGQAFSDMGQPEVQNIQKGLEEGRTKIKNYEPTFKGGGRPTSTQPAAFPEKTTTGEEITESQDNRTTPQLDIPVTGPLNGDNVMGLYSKYFNSMGTLDGAEKFVDTFQKANQQEREFQLQNLNRQEAQREKLLEVEEGIRNTTAPWIKRDYTDKGIEFPSYMESWVNKMVLEGKGPIEGRYRVAKQQVDNTLNRLNSLDNSEKRPWGAAFRKRDHEKYLRQKKLFVDQTLNNPLIPNWARKDLIEDAQQKLVANGDGLVDAEYMTNRPTKENAQKIDSVGKYKPSTKTLKGSSRTLGMKVAENPNEDLKTIERLSETVYDLAGGMTSPLIVRNRWLDLNYTESQIRDAFALADERGAPFSEYQRNQIAELATPERPSIGTVAGGEKTLRGMWDIFISGKK